MNNDKITRRRIVLTGALAGGAIVLRGGSAAAQVAQPHDHAGHAQGGTTRPAENAGGQAALPPGEPGRDYNPVVVPNGWTLPYKVVDGVKVFHLVAEEVYHEFAPGLRAHCWGYNGSVHGPVI